MSTDEQNAIIIRLLRELTEAKKYLAPARQSLRSTARDFGALSQVLENAAKGDCLRARMTIAAVFDPSAVDHLKSRFDDMERLPRRIEEIQATLKAAGIEN
jgi:lambda repressor-like predicted transcriptional regulator